MTDSVVTDAPVLGSDDLKELDDQAWRRVGISQTFDRLLVLDVASTPGSTEGTRDRIGANLHGGAAKFWAISFPQLKKDLIRRSVLAEADGNLALDATFYDRLMAVIADAREVHSQTTLTSGITLEEVLAMQRAREAKLKKAKPATRAKRTTGVTRARAPKGTAAPLKRVKSTDGGPKAPTVKTSLPKRTAKATVLLEPKKLFTSLKLNRLLDALDNASMTSNQLGDRLKMGAIDMRRFINIGVKLEILRENSELIELHWKGRELARTSSADRRMALIGVVQELRQAATEPAKPAESPEPTETAETAETTEPTENG